MKLLLGKQRMRNTKGHQILLDVSWDSTHFGSRAGPCLGQLTALALWKLVQCQFIVFIPFLVLLLFLPFPMFCTDVSRKGIGKYAFWNCTVFTAQFLLVQF